MHREEARHHPQAPRPRLAAALVLILLVLPLTGCLGEDVGGNQNLRAPKLVVTSTPEGDNTVYVHAAFTGERMYDRIQLTMDNTTLEERYVYALHTKTNNSTFHLTVDVQEDDAWFSYQARFHLQPTQGTLSVVPLTPEGEGPMQNATLPFSKVIPPVEVT